FLVLLTIDPHVPYLPSRTHDAARFRSRSGADGQISTLRRLSKSRTPDDEARIRELYQAEVKSTDESFGKLVSTLKKEGELEETIVVVTGDHGEAFWEYGTQGHGEGLSRELLQVPLIIRYPRDRRLPPGARTQMPISSVDLGPTLLELAGLGIPNRLDGESFFGSAIQDRAPILAGLNTQSHSLLTAMKSPYKLLWDRNRGEISLFDMRVSLPEAEPYDPRPDEKAAQAREELIEALVEGLRVRDEEISGGVAGELSPTIERELRALGHTP
ncbi:sulfatase-like hydrolase/transferase, partial [Myxococcota bacterium]|nr:sulfatase-like hydrolase/transferase [Myxococcota bacterium]